MMKKLNKKIIASILILFMFVICTHAQEIQETEEIPVEQEILETEEAPEAEKKSFLDSTSFVLKLPTTVYLNMMDKKASAPSPIVFSPGFGFTWPNDTYISFEPSVNIFFSYFLFYNGMALPAEIENRSASTLSILLDLPAAFRIDIKSTKLQLNVGPALLMRISWAANGSGSSDAEIAEINNWLWGQARFLYLSGSVSWIVSLPSKSQFGPFLTVYAPLGSIFAREGLNGMIISVGLKISYNR